MPVLAISNRERARQLVEVALAAQQIDPSLVTDQKRLSGLIRMLHTPLEGATRQAA
jgi:hypothetical protein